MKIELTSEFRRKFKNFGKVDSKTKKFRNAYQKAGYSVVFYDGMTQKECEKIIKS